MKSVALIIPLLLPLHAFAGGSGMPGSQPSSATANAASASHSVATARVSGRVTSNVTVNAPQNATGSAQNSGNDGRATGAGSGPGNGGNRTPDIFAPSINGGSPCSVGATIGGSGPVAGGLFGWLWEDHDCALRQQAALMANLGRRDVAIEILCHDAWVRDAMAKAHTPCEIDRQRWLAAGWKP